MSAEPPDSRRREPFLQLLDELLRLLALESLILGVLEIAIPAARARPPSRARSAFLPRPLGVLLTPLGVLLACLHLIQ